MLDQQQPGQGREDLLSLLQPGNFQYSNVKPVLQRVLKALADGLLGNSCLFVVGSLEKAQPAHSCAQGFNFSMVRGAR